MAGKWRWNTAQFAERKWWQNYLKNKEVSEYLNWKKNYWNNLLQKCNPFFSINEKDTILDAGCGPAGMFMLFNKNNTTAFDPLIDTYEIDLPHFKKSAYPSVTFINKGLEDISIHEKFDKIFCMNAINHVHDIELSYDNLIHLAKAEAHIIVTIDAHNHSFFKKLFRLLPGDILHPHQYDLKEYEDFLTSRNCDIIQSIHLKHDFFFDHYMLIAKKK
jgi:2-polyprenyl-6-hydroxyphenyl methylase/3-demethylubiquinone-9 3-methyltransferase